MLHFLLSLTLSRKSTTLLLSHRALTCRLLSSQKNSSQDTGLLRSLSDLFKSSVVATLSSSHVLFKFSEKQSEVSQALRDVLPGTLFFKPSTTATFYLATASLRHRTSTTSIRNFRQQKKSSLISLYRQHLQHKLMEVRSPFKPHFHSTRLFPNLQS